MLSILLLNHLQQSLPITAVIKKDTVDRILSTTRKSISLNIEDFATRVITE